jgi:putative transposase
MPNHFHFLVSTKSDFNSVKFSNAFRTLLSSYTRAIQKQENMTGSLFQQNTKAKELTDNKYASSCFHYIHQNPFRSQLVDKLKIGLIIHLMNIGKILKEFAT